MTGKVIDSGANGLLLVLLPLAFAIVVIFVFWPLLLGLFVLALGWKLWQMYQWQQLSEKIDPLFNQLVQAHQGTLTILDVSMKTDLNARTARFYLERKAEEYGAVRRLYEDRGIVYYFLTASALGSIFDESEPDSEAELAPSRITPRPFATSPSVDREIEARPQTEIITSESEARLNFTATETQATSHPSRETSVAADRQAQSSPPLQTSPPEQSPPPTPVAAVSDSDSSSEVDQLQLNQGELAKRLEVHSSTIGKRKSEPDFAMWSQSRDPDGIPWHYLEEEKLFIPLESETS